MDKLIKEASILLFHTEIIDYLKIVLNLEKSFFRVHMNDMRYSL